MPLRTAETFRDPTRRPPPTPFRELALAQTHAGVLITSRWQRLTRKTPLLVSPSPPSWTVVPLRTADPFRDPTRRPPPTPFRELALAQALSVAQAQRAAAPPAASRRLDRSWARRRGRRAGSGHVCVRPARAQ